MAARQGCAELIINVRTVILIDRKPSLVILAKKTTSLNRIIDTSTPVLLKSSSQR